MKPDHPRSRTSAAVLTGLFMVAVSLPLVSMCFGWGRGPELGEKRQLTPPPARPATLAEWSAFPRACEMYFQDSFGWRNWLIAYRGRMVLSGWVSHPDVLFDPRSRMMFYRPDKASAGHFSTASDGAKRTRIIRALRLKAKWAETRGLHYLFVAIPQRLSLYPEAHPMGRYMQNQRLLDAVARELGGPACQSFLDVTPVLAAHRRDSQEIYYRTDTHWTDYGARLAYGEIMRRLLNQGLELPPFPAAAFRFEPEPMAGDITGLLGINSFTHWLETRISPVLRESTLRKLESLDAEGRVIAPQEDRPENLLRACREGRQFRLSGVSTGPRALVIRDSFTTALVPYLAEHFSEATFVRTIPGEYDLPAWVERTRPDVVLEIFGEGNIMRF